MKKSTLPGFLTFPEVRRSISRSESSLREISDYRTQPRLILINPAQIESIEIPDRPPSGDAFAAFRFAIRIRMVSGISHHVGFDDPSSLDRLISDPADQDRIRGSLFLIWDPAAILSPDRISDPDPTPPPSPIASPDPVC